ncbi:MAG: hypothetical protein K6G39_07880 [Bacteroidales bacterium]|nr:hypothetical protein [Bacteroidales bacterium]
MPVPQKNDLLKSALGEEGYRKYIEDQSHENMRENRPVANENADSTTLLSIKLKDDDTVDVDSVFFKLHAADVQMAISSYTPEFLNKVFSHGKTQADSVRLFLGHLFAAMAAVYPKETSDEIVKEFQGAVDYYRSILKR